jgi:hypothetical protein
MRLWVALLVSTTVACGGKAINPTTTVEPENPTPAPTNTPAPDNPTASPTPTPAPTIVMTLPSSPPDAGGPVVTPVPLWIENTAGTIVFEPTLVDATRYSEICGVMNPSFMNGDLYSLDIVDQRGATPYAALSVSFSSPAPVGTPQMLTVQPFTSEGTGIGEPDGGTMWYAGQNAQGSGFNFQFSQGAHLTEVDPGAFDSVTVTILAMPTADGQPLTVRIQMHFVDGNTVDETFSNSLVSSYIGCSAG